MQFNIITRKLLQHSLTREATWLDVWACNSIIPHEIFRWIQQTQIPLCEESVVQKSLPCTNMPLCLFCLSSIEISPERNQLHAIDISDRNKLVTHPFHVSQTDMKTQRFDCCWHKIGSRLFTGTIIKVGSQCDYHASWFYFYSNMKHWHIGLWPI